MAQIDVKSDRRQYQRFPLATSVQFHHGPTQREIPARSMDVSANGMLMSVPPNTPVHAGQAVKLNMSQFPLRSLNHVANGSVSATVVRVDRGCLTSEGQLLIGVRFAAA